MEGISVNEESKKPLPTPGGQKIKNPIKNNPLLAMEDPKTRVVQSMPQRKQIPSLIFESLWKFISEGGWKKGVGGSGSVSHKTDQISVKNDEKKKMKQLLDVEESETTDDVQGRGKGEEKGSVVVDVWSKAECEASPSSDIDRRRVDKVPMIIKPQVSLPPPPPPRSRSELPFSMLYDYDTLKRRRCRSTPPPQREEVQVPHPPPSDKINKIEIRNIQPKDRDPLQLQESSGIAIAETVVALSQSNNRAKKWEILQCIVRCSLFELVTSLLLLTSAATSNISNGNIVALTLTNLITGLFIFRPYLMRVVKKHKVQMGLSGAELEQINWGNEVFKDIMHYFLPFTMIISSFLIFGMVPPLVYAFTFHNIDDKNLKLAATLGASLLCTSLLIILAMYLQKLNGWLVYVKSILCCAFVVVFLFGLSYLLGYLFGKLVAKLDWFE